MLSARLKKEHTINKAVQEGLIALLFARLTDMSYSYQDKGYCPMWAKKNAETIYKAYHLLGGNGTITDAYQRLMNLPLEQKNQIREDGH